MAEVCVTEKHSVSTVGSDRAEVEIKIYSEVPYKFVRAVEDEIYKFVENLKRINEGSSGFVNTPYSEEEIQVIRGSTRENVWERYQEAFPKSRRTRIGVISYFKKLAQFEKYTKPVREAKVEYVLESTTKLNAWQRKFVLKYAKETDTPGVYSGLGKFHKKWPGAKLDGEMIRAVLAEGKAGPAPEPKMTKKVPKKLKSGEPAPALVLNSPASKFKIGDKVTQFKGLAPAHGVGTVESVRGDGVTTVKFIGSKKVLPMDNFILVTPTE